MKLPHITLATLISIAILAAVSVIFYEQEVKPEFQPRPTLQSEPDFYLTQMKVTEYRDSGQVRYYFVADQAEHFPDGDYTLAERPDITLFDEKGIPWLIQAMKGRVTANYQTVKLWDQVIMQRDTPADPLELSTRAMTLFPKRDYAETEQPVRITSLNSLVTATGMQAYLDQERVELLNHVKVRHEPAESP